MKVTYRKHCQPSKKYQEVKSGEAFRTLKTGERIFVKTDTTGFSGAAAVALTTGAIHSFEDDCDVQVVNCEVVVG